MATVQVLFFSVLKQKVGEGRVSVTLDEPATGADLLDQLEARYPVLGPYRSVVRLAVNATYAAEAVPLADGDEVALITPVSGG